jgi:peptidoglycan/LPS O-acetylase OafA/YrhL
MFFQHYPHVEPGLATAPVKTMYFVLGFAGDAVLVFYVLSGFFISSAILKDHVRGRWSWKEYAISRGARLYLVLIPALLLTALWDGIGIARFDGFGRYSGAVPDMGFRTFQSTYTVQDFFGSLLFLRPGFGSDGVIWTLFCEFWFYVAFPALVCAWLAVRRKRYAEAAGFVALAWAAEWMLGSWRGGFAIWLFGFGVAVAANYLRFPNQWRRATWLLTVLAGLSFGAELVAIRVGKPMPGGAYAEVLLFAVFLYGLVQLPLPAGLIWTWMAKEGAGFSYSLYLMHAPVLLLINAMLGGSVSRRWQPDTRHMAIFLGICGAVIVYSYVLAQMTEKHTTRVRAWLRLQSLRLEGRAAGVSR